MNLSKVNVRKSPLDEWWVWVPVPPEFGPDDQLPGPYGDTYWPTFDEAVGFVRLVLADKETR